MTRKRSALAGAILPRKAANPDPDTSARRGYSAGLVQT